MPGGPLEVEASALLPQTDLSVEVAPAADDSERQPQKQRRTAGRHAVYESQTIHVGGLGSKEDNERLEELFRPKSKSAPPGRAALLRTLSQRIAQDDGDDEPPQESAPKERSRTLLQDSQLKEVKQKLEGELKELLKPFGTVLAVTVRVRHDKATTTASGKLVPAKVSWALVTFSTRDEADAAIGEADSLSDANLRIRRLDLNHALASTGAMAKVAIEHHEELDAVDVEAMFDAADAAKRELAQKKAIRHAVYEDQTVHVGGLSVELEQEERLKKLFERLGGAVIAVTVRIRHEEATTTASGDHVPAKVSWALVTFSSRDETDAAIQEADTLGLRNLRVRKLDLKQATESTGSMAEIARNHQGQLDVVDMGAVFDAMIDAADEKPDPITALAISAFKKFDANGDGALDVKEIKGVLEELGYPQGEGGRCARLATCCCKDRSNSISTDTQDSTGAETEDRALTAKEALEACGADDDGHLNQQKFVEWFSRFG